MPRGIELSFDFIPEIKQISCSKGMKMSQNTTGKLFAKTNHRISLLFLIFPFTHKCIFMPTFRHFLHFEYPYGLITEG
jgi:hypothetical protein